MQELSSVSSVLYYGKKKNG